MTAHLVKATRLAFHFARWELSMILSYTSVVHC